MADAIDYTALAKQAGAISSTPASGSTAAPSSNTPVDYTALAKQAGAVSSTPPPSTPDSGGILSTIGDAAKGVGHFAEGVGEGAVTGMGETIQSLPYVGKKIISPEAMQAERALFAPGSAAEKSGEAVGNIAEPVLEFVMGDEALKGLALADKIGLAGKISDIVKDSPYIGKLLQHGVGVARMGTVGTAEALAKGATLPDAIKTGAETGLGGEALSAVAEPVAEALKNPYRTAKAAAGAVADTVKGAVSKLTGSEVQPALKAGIQSVWNDVADAAGVPHPTAESVQDMGQEVGDAVYARAKAAYKTIDDETGSRLTATETKLKNVTKALRSVTNDEEEGKLLIQKQRYEMQMENMFDKATAAGKGDLKAIVKAAKSDFKAAQSIYDTNDQIRLSSTGVRPGLEGAEETPESVDPKKMMGRLNKLYNNGRLQQVPGDVSEDLMGHSAIAQKAAKDVARNQSIAKKALTVGGTGIIGGEIAKHALE